MESLFFDDASWDKAANECEVPMEFDPLWEDDEGYDHAANGYIPPSDDIQFDDDEEFNGNGKRLHDRREDLISKRIQSGQGIDTNADVQPFIKFELIRTHEPRQINRFHRQIYKKVYKAVHNLDKVDILFMGNKIDNIFDEFLSDILDEAEDEDQVSVSITNGHLSNAIFVSYKKKNFQIKELVNKMAEIVQSESGRNFILAENFQVETALTKRIEGSGRGFLHSKNRAPRDIQTLSKCKRSVTVINNNDNACGYWAVALAKFRQEISASNDWGSIRMNKAKRLENAARILCQEAGVDYNKPMTAVEMQVLDGWLKPKYQLICIDASNHQNRIFKGVKAEIPIFIEYNDNHYNAITGNITGYMDFTWILHGRFCVNCWVSYDEKSPHKCPGACPCCFTDPACPVTNTINCFTCKRNFYGFQCLEKHLGNICKTRKKCEECEIEYLDKYPHKCNEIWCNICKTHSIGKHNCFMQKKDSEKIEKEDNRSKIIVSFDIESMLVEKDGYFDHQPNLLVSLICCDKCYNDEQNKASESCEVCGDGEKTYRGSDCVKQFMDYILGPLAKVAEKIKGKLFVFAHNLKGYDGHFILNDLFKRNMKPEPIMCGTKILMIDIGNVRFVDSLNLFMMPLASLPKSFGFESIVLKGYFPHRFNIPANQSYTGLLPDASFYEPTLMLPDAKKKFDKWHTAEKAKEGTWSFVEQIYSYCYNDTWILQLAVMKFRILFKSITQIDPISRCFTLASIGLEVYRTNFLKENSIAITPVNGYSNRTSSAAGDSWLDWIDFTLKRQVGREHKFGPYYADGYDKVTNTIYEYVGDYYHGCPTHYPDQTVLLRKKEGQQATAGELYEIWQQKLAYYKRKGFNVVWFWGCEVDKQMKEDMEMKKFIETRLAHYKDLAVNGNASIRDSFCGGRTNNVRFFHDCSGKADEWIKYLDVTSEYPFVLKNKVYPVGHPTVIRSNFDGERLKPGHEDGYFGFVRCSVIPPLDLFLPVLPKRYDGKLMFVLCNKCALESNKNVAIHGVECQHSEEERKLTGTFTTIELNMAVRKGYKIVDIKEVLHYKERSGELFTAYINMWLKVKQEASGWPKANMTEDEKSQYISEYLKHEGIQLDRDMIVKNPGRRSIAKLMLNSFWGKLSQRPNLPKTTVCKEYYEYQEIINNSKLKILGEHQVDDSTLIVSTELADGSEAQPGNTNIAIASFVTSYARLHLYGFMDRVVDIGRDRLLYFDTDSIIFVRKQGDPVIETGNFLGDLTDELADYGEAARCTRFVSGGPKNYGYEVEIEKDGVVENKTTIKTKGLKHDTKTLNVITVKEMTDMAEEYVKSFKSKEHKVQQLRFVSHKYLHYVRSYMQEKVYRMVSTKRRIVGNATLPFGYRDV